SRAGASSWGSSIRTSSYSRAAAKTASDYSGARLRTCAGHGFSVRGELLRAVAGRWGWQQQGSGRRFGERRGFGRRRGCRGAGAPTGTGTGFARGGRGWGGGSVLTGGGGNGGGRGVCVETPSLGGPSPTRRPPAAPCSPSSPTSRATGGGSGGFTSPGSTCS